jgi:hypothetical protein
VFVHVDANANLEVFEQACSNATNSGNVHFIKNRVHGIWGHFSLVEATLLLLRTAAKHQLDFDHFILLSGQDFPLKSHAFITDFLSSRKTYDFIESYPLPSDKLRERQGGLYRVNRHHKIGEKIHDEFPPYSRKPVLNSIFNALADIHHRYIRKMPLGMAPCAGSQWWMLSRKSVLNLLHFLDNHSEVEQFFRNVWIPDEVFFQTVLNQINEDGSQLIKANYRFTKWDKKESRPFTTSPAILTAADFDELQQSDALFARKFDEIESEELVELVSKKLL